MTYLGITIVKKCGYYWALGKCFKTLAQVKTAIKNAEL